MPTLPGPHATQQQLARLTPAQHQLWQEFFHPKSFLEQLGVSPSANNLVGLGAAIAGTAGIGASVASGTLGADALTSEAAASNAASSSAAGSAAGAASGIASQAGSTLLKDATIGSLLGGLLTWGPGRIVELLIGLVLLFIGIKTLTGVNGPSPGAIARAAA